MEARLNCGRAWQPGHLRRTVGSAVVQELPRFQGERVSRTKAPPAKTHERPAYSPSAFLNAAWWGHPLSRVPEQLTPYSKKAQSLLDIPPTRHTLGPNESGRL